MKCDRCNIKTNSWMMSFFNEDVLCLECVNLEKEHPLYQVALDIERVHLKAGDRNYKGIGLPDDLKKHYKGLVK